MRRIAACLAISIATAPSAAGSFTIATWNLEWMMTPDTFDALAASCSRTGLRARGDERSIPCDLVPKSRWSDDDLRRIRDFAATLPADVIALQEIDGKQVAKEIFRDHAFCFTKRRHVQNVGFAIRRGIRFRCNRDDRALGLPENDVRWGADVTIDPGTPRAIRLLAVHLKASCSRDPLTDARPDCATLQRQVPVLEDWIDSRARAGESFAVIGDFNRRFDREGKVPRDAAGAIVAMWPEIDDGEPDGADLVNPGLGRGAVGCGNGHGSRMPIDHLILGRSLARGLVADSYRVWEYPEGPRWPDHCVISIELDRESIRGSPHGV